MPIKAENKHRYHPTWREIRAPFASVVICKEHHQKTAYQTRRSGKALGELFDAC